MNIRRITRWVLFLFAAAMLAACGFHLKGQYDVQFTSVFLSFSGSKSQTARHLKRIIERQNIATIAKSPKEAEVIVRMLAEEEKKEELTYNTNARVREYSLYYILDYEITTPAGKVLLEPTTLTARKTMTYDDSEALSKETEAQLLFSAMEKDAADTILRKLTAIRLTEEDIKYIKEARENAETVGDDPVEKILESKEAPNF